MNLLDVVIILLALSAVFRGFQVGLARQLLSTIGFFGGLWLGTIVSPHLVSLVNSQSGRSLVTIVATFGVAFLGLSIGEYIGIVLKIKELHFKLLDQADNALGSVLAVGSALLSAWLIAAVTLSLPLTGVQTVVRSSVIISSLNRVLPPAATIIASLSHAIDPNGFPQVFQGLEPAPNQHVALPSLASLQPAISKDSPSVVKIVGQGCGGIVEGSGFVISKDLISTNAHVVAGIQDPIVVDGNGNHHATAIWFDPNLDFAVLRVTNLAGQPLALSTTTSKQGTGGAILGYPGGGAFNVKPAAIMDDLTATGRNIYNQAVISRNVYELKADVIPGNSGGPLIASDGTVIGIVFAQSTTYNHVGYALQLSAVNKEIAQAKALNNAVSTGSCAE